MSPVLVDTSVWVDHFRRNNIKLTELLVHDLVMVHPLVIGELACGTPPDRSRTLADLNSLREVHQATLQETMEFIERERLYGLGCGVVDLLLLASTIMTNGAKIWTLDHRLHSLAERFDVVHN